MSRLDTRRNRFLLAGLTTVTSLLVLGLVWWLLQPSPQPTGIGDEFSFYDQSGRPISGRSGALKLVLDPVTIFANWPSQRTAQFTVDERRFRATPRRDGHPQILVLGGSAAFGWHLSSDQMTFAWLLGERMTDYEVVNAAVNGFQSGQEIALMIHRLDHPRARAYVVFDGWNDLIDPFGQAPSDRRPIQLLGFNNTFLLIQDRLYELYHRDHAAAAEQGRLPSPKRRAMSDDDYVAAITRTYLGNLDRMHTFARARGADFLAVLQPELGNKPILTEAETRILAQTLWYTKLGLAKRYTAMRRAAVEFCRTHGIPHVDVEGTPEFRGEREPLFIDVVHLNERGHRLVAQLIERGLRELHPRAGSRGASNGTRGG